MSSKGELIPHSLPVSNVLKCIDPTTTFYTTGLYFNDAIVMPPIYDRFITFRGKVLRFFNDVTETSAATTPSLATYPPNITKRHSLVKRFR